MPETKQEAGAEPMSPFKALSCLANGNSWLQERLGDNYKCTCNACYLCAYLTLRDAIEPDPIADRVASNISTIRDLHERSLRLIQNVCSQSLRAHPEHPESYPAVLQLAEQARQGDEPDVMIGDGMGNPQMG